MKKEYLGALLISFSAAMWGFDGIVLTPRLYKLDPTYVVFILHFLPFVGMSIFWGREEFKNIHRMRKDEKFYFFLIALFGGVIGTLSIVKALFLIDFKNLTIVTLLEKLQPVFAIVLARVILREKVKKNFVFWAIIALISGYFLTFQSTLPKFSTDKNFVIASFYAILAAFSFGSSTVFGKKVLNSSSFKTALFTRYFFTTLITAVLLLFNGTYIEFINTTWEQWFIFILIGATTGSGAILIYYYGLKYVKANVATICELFFPISSILFEYIFYGAKLQPVQFVSIVVMLYAICKISLKREF